MAAAVAGDVHDMMLASAETRLGRTGAVPRRRISRLPEERDQIGETGRLRSACGGESSMSAAEGTSAKAQCSGWVLRGVFGALGRRVLGPPKIDGARGVVREVG